MLQIGIQKKQGSVIEILKEEILSGNIPCGTEMTQKELADSLGVSRMPVREALILLEYQGLIERLPNNHVRVAEFTGNYFHEVLFLCAELEYNALETGFVFDEVENQSRCIESSPEEILIHNQIKKYISNVFLQKIFGTIIEIYVDFAVRCQEYDRKKGTKLLKSAISASKEQRRNLLNQYFSELENTILNERKEKC